MSKLGPAAPAVAARHLPLTAYYAALGAWRSVRAEDLRSTVLVAGSPRSGTSWLGEVLAGMAGRPLLYEPTQVQAIPQMQQNHQWCGRPFREPDERDDELAEDLERLLTGRYLGPGLVRRSRQIDAALWARSPLVTKVVDLNLLLPWAAVNLPWLRVVHLVRHPLAVIASQEAWDGSFWSTRTTLSDPYRRFIAAHPEYDAPSSYRSVAEHLVTIWAIEHAWLRDRADDLRGIVTVRYEDLRADLADEAVRLASAVDLPLPTPEPLLRLDVPSASVNAAASTLGGSPSSGWRIRYRDDQLDRLRSILERYQHPFYGADEC